MSRLPAVVLALLSIALAAPARAQSIQDLRNQLRSELTQDQFGGSIVTLILLSNELELSGINYELDDEVGTEINALVLPFNYTFRPFEDQRTGLYTEGVIGTSTMDQSGPDLFNGDAPGIETAFNTEWRTFGGLLGVGPERQLSEEVSVAAIGQLGLSYLENRAIYEGPGAELSSQLFDGLLFNWDAWAVTYGVAARLRWHRALGSGRSIEFTGRYDVRWTDAFEVEEEIHDFLTKSELTTFRLQYRALTGLRMGRYPIGWRTHAGISWVLASETADPFGLIEVGGGLDLLTQRDLPYVDGLTAGGAVFLGDGVAGWTVGVGIVL
ncbi:MAG: hypothetical protein AAGB93_12705 [Planctomycetota bacterium]